MLYRHFAARMRAWYEMWSSVVCKNRYEYRRSGFQSGFSLSQSQFLQSCVSASPLQSSQGEISAPSASVHEFPGRFH